MIKNKHYILKSHILITNVFDYEQFIKILKKNSSISSFKLKKNTFSYYSSSLQIFSDSIPPYLKLEGEFNINNSEVSIKISPTKFFLLNLFFPYFASLSSLLFSYTRNGIDYDWLLIYLIAPLFFVFFTYLIYFLTKISLIRKLEKDFSELNEDA